MKEIDEKIEAYLNQDNPGYWEGVELYSDHPSARRNIVINLNQAWNKQFMHEKLISELETVVGIEKHSGKLAVLEHRPGNIPVKIIDKAKEAAPPDYEYKVKFEKLPDELKTLVVEKGQLYTALTIKKKDLAEIGEVNDDQSIAKRKVILKDMHKMVDRIKGIHQILIGFDKDRNFDKDYFQGFMRQVVGGSTMEIGQEKELSDEQLLDAEFGFVKMDYYQRKDLLVRLRSAVIKQEQRAQETNKPNIVEKNKQKAELGRKMIALLEQYFEETQEPEK